MNKAFEKILERLEKLRNNICGDIKCCECKYERICNPIDEHYEKIFVDNAVKIVKEAAEEYNGGWIPVSERLPDDFMSFEYLTMRKGHTLATISYYCVVNNKWYSSRNSTKEIEVIAWQQLPEPYKENE